MGHSRYSYPLLMFFLVAGCCCCVMTTLIAADGGESANGGTNGNKTASIQAIYGRQADIDQRIRDTDPDTLIEEETTTVTTSTTVEPTTLVAIVQPVVLVSAITVNATEIADAIAVNATETANTTTTVSIETLILLQHVDEKDEEKDEEKNEEKDEGLLKHFDFDAIRVTVPRVLHVLACEEMAVLRFIGRKVEQLWGELF